MSGEGFLDRWSRRKRTARPAEPQATGPDPQSATQPDLAPEPAPPLVPPDPPETLPPEELARLTPLEQMDADTDLGQFLRKGVPQALRNAALRRKWMLNPAIRDHDDIAVDYAWDWNVPGGVPGDGGPLNQDRVARMARQLLEPDQPARTADATGPRDTSDPGMDPPLAQDRSAEPRPVPAARAETAGHPQDPADEAAAPSGRDPAAPHRSESAGSHRTGPDAAPAPRRRHGGAAPA